MLNAGSKLSVIEIGFKKQLSKRQASKLPVGLIIKNKQEEYQFLYKVMVSE